MFIVHLKTENFFDIISTLVAKQINLNYYNQAPQIMYAEGRTIDLHMQTFKKVSIIYVNSKSLVQIFTSQTDCKLEIFV